MVLERALDKVCGAVYKARLEAQGVPEALFHGFWSQEGQAGCTCSQALSRVFLPVSIPSHRLDLNEEFREKVLLASVGVC